MRKLLAPSASVLSKWVIQDRSWTDSSILTAFLCWHDWRHLIEEAIMNNENASNYMSWWVIQKDGFYIAAFFALGLVALGKAGNFKSIQLTIPDTKLTSYNKILHIFFRCWSGESLLSLREIFYCSMSEHANHQGKEKKVFILKITRFFTIDQQW